MKRWKYKDRDEGPFSNINIEAIRVGTNKAFKKLFGYTPFKTESEERETKKRSKLL